jgi:hypothetical protein
MLAGANGIGTTYNTGYDAFFVVDGNGIIRYRRNNSPGHPAWHPESIEPVVDQALAELSTPVSFTPDRGFFLEAAFPNPFNPTTTIPYRLDGTGEEAPVQLQILDLRGRIVRTLVAESQVTGQVYEILWNGHDDNGRSVSSGTYISSLTVWGKNHSRFLTLVK